MKFCFNDGELAIFCIGSSPAVNENRIHFINPKPTKHQVSSCEGAQGTPVRNIHEEKAWLYIWWGQSGVLYYKLLKLSKTVTGDHYRQWMEDLNHVLVVKQPELAERRDRVMLVHDNSRSRVAIPAQDTIKALKWGILPSPLAVRTLPRRITICYSWWHTASVFTNFDNTKKWLDERIAAKRE